MPTQPVYPQYQSFNCLTPDEAIVLTQGYVSFIQSQGAANLISLFKNGLQYLTGYVMTLSDYTALISFPGVSIWKLRFAYKQGEQNNMLQFLLVGCTASGIEMTPYFQLKQILTDDLSGILPISTQHGGEKQPNFQLGQKSTENLSDRSPAIPQYRVPSSLIYPWGKAYTALIQEQNIPSVVLQSPWCSGNILQGYNFDFSDFLDILYNDSLGVLPNDSIIELRVMNHAEHREGTAQSILPGMIGVAITAINPNNAPSENFTFYDISKPCPPTC